MTDTEMLDWLECRNALLNFADGGPHVCIDDGRDYNFHAYGSTYRDAIQNAIKTYVPYVHPPRPVLPICTEIRVDSDMIINGQLVQAGTVWRPA